MITLILILIMILTIFNFSESFNKIMILYQIKMYFNYLSYLLDDKIVRIYQFRIKHIQF